MLPAIGTKFGMLNSIFSSAHEKLIRTGSAVPGWYRIECMEYACGGVSFEWIERMGRTNVRLERGECFGSLPDRDRHNSHVQLPGLSAGDQSLHQQQQRQHRYTA